MVKRFILRKDGILQRYNIKHIENYEQISKIGKDYLFQKVSVAEKRERIIKEQLKKKRMRTQICMNSNYAVSLRAISINNATETELEIALREFLNSNPNLQKIPFETLGFEQEEIDDKEDKFIGKGINIELNIRGKVTYTEI